MNDDPTFIAGLADVAAAALSESAARAGGRVLTDRHQKRGRR